MTGYFTCMYVYCCCLGRRALQQASAESCVYVERDPGSSTLLQFEFDLEPSVSSVRFVYLYIYHTTMAYHYLLVRLDRFTYLSPLL